MTDSKQTRIKYKKEAAEWLLLSPEERLFIANNVLNSYPVEHNQVNKIQKQEELWKKK